MTRLSRSFIRGALRRAPALAPAVRRASILLPVIIALFAAVAVHALASAMPTPPVAAQIPTTLEANGDVRIDPYYWLRERDNPAVLTYLEEENAYLDSVMTPTAALQETLFTEMKNRIRPDDSTVPYLSRGYYYYDRFEEGGEYPLHCRKKDSLDAPEEVMLDTNKLGAGQAYFAIWGRAVSEDGRFYAFAADTVGRRFFTIHVKDLTTGRMLPDAIHDVSSDFVWANDNNTIFYIRQDPETLRYYRLYRHRLGADAASDSLIYEEPDDTFDCSLEKSKTHQYIFLSSLQTVSTEVRYLNADDPNGEFRVIEPRQRDHEYSVDQLGDYFYIRTNWNAENFRLMRAPVSKPGRAHWEEVIPHRTDVFFEDFELFRDQLVAVERRDGLLRLRVIPWDGSPDHEIDFGEPTYLAYLGANAEIDLSYLRFVYTSFVTPWSTFDYDMTTREKQLRKQDEVLGGYDPSVYVEERLHATAPDGEQVPISIVYPRGAKRDGSMPLLLDGYGAYGISSDALFSASRLSLLERSFGYAIAHVRGGQELGRRWYEEGRLLNKRNTFTDFIACGEYLVDQGYTSPDRLFAYGASAGGLLMGAIVNMAPDLFEGVVAEVPFVDLMTTMLDPSIPLTTAEYDEWGNPNDRVYYDYMKSYSPYDNLTARDYPNLLVTTGLQDSQVQYWEPAKWVAKIRTLKTNDNLLLLHTNLEAGHGGTSGRYRQYHETALVYAFMLNLVGITK